MGTKGKTRFITSAMGRQDERSHHQHCIQIDIQPLAILIQNVASSN